MLGWYLAGELEVYRVFTKSMSLGPKIDRVKEMCKSLISDVDLRKKISAFCVNLKDAIVKRNDAVHALYGVDRGDVIRINLRASPDKRRIIVTPEDLSNLSIEILKLAHEGSSLSEQVKKHRQKPS